MSNMRTPLLVAKIVKFQLNWVLSLTVHNFIYCFNSLQLMDSVNCN